MNLEAKWLSLSSLSNAQCNVIVGSTNSAVAMRWCLVLLDIITFISVFNQLDAQNLFHNKFYFVLLHVSSTCAHHQEVKIALHSLWYHHTETSERSKINEIQFYKYEEIEVGVHLWWVMNWCVMSTKECVTTDVSLFLICPCTFLRFQGLYDIVSSG